MRGCVLDGKVSFPDGRPHLPRRPELDRTSGDANDPYGEG
jgi:hypothetical protein